VTRRSEGADGMTLFSGPNSVLRILPAPPQPGINAVPWRDLSRRVYWSR